MNPKHIDDIRPLVWTISIDKVSRDSGNAYCIYLNGNLHAENMNVDTFISMYNELKKNR